MGGETGPALSYYNPESRNFRGKEGHGPIRMARKQRIWDDWLSWRDTWRMEQRRGNGRKISAATAVPSRQTAPRSRMGEPHGSEHVWHPSASTTTRTGANQWTSTRRRLPLRTRRPLTLTPPIRRMGTSSRRLWRRTLDWSKSRQWTVVH